MDLLTLALYQPDIAQNTGTLIRTAACLGLKLAVIEPCGFVFSDRFMQRAAMDYAEIAAVVRHDSWDKFLETIGQRRLINIETDGTTAYTDFAFQPGDILLLGSEAHGTPDFVKTACTASVVIPMQPGVRSLNVAIAGALVAGEALRQIALHE